MAGPRIPVVPLFLALAAIAVTYTGVSTVRFVVRNYELREEERDVRAELRQLDRDHEQLIAVRDYLKSDEYIEDIARRVLGLVRPGETLVVVSGTDPAAEAPPAAAAPGEPWWKALFVAPAAAPTPSAGAVP